MAGSNRSRSGSGRGSGGSATAEAASAKNLKTYASVSSAAFDRRYKRVDKDVAEVRRYLNESDRYNAWRDNPRSTGPAPDSYKVGSPAYRRTFQSRTTAAKARAFYEGLSTNRATGMPQSLQAGFADRPRQSTGTKKAAGRKRSRLVKA